MKFSFASFLVATALCLDHELPVSNAFAAEPDLVVFTFAVTGDSRQDAKAVDLTAQEKIWMQNTKVLARILREVQVQKPQALFFTGDMIMGYSTNLSASAQQYAYWRGMMSALIENGIYVVPVAGNHETQIKFQTADDDKGQKISRPECESLWRDYMGDLILDTNLWQRLTGEPIAAWDYDNIPRVGGPDPIQSDQHSLNFSFDSGKMHFAVINTSPVGNQSHAPVHWLGDDLARARQRGCQNLFVFGHEMAFRYDFGGKDKEKETGLDAHPEDAEAFWNLIQTNHATYFCGHEHLYHAMQPIKQGVHPAWQIIVGAAGAPFNAKPGQSANPQDRMYAWSLVRVYRSGRAQMEAFGFDEHFGATRLIERIELQIPIEEAPNSKAQASVK